jgi:hypothetical protein
MPRFDQPIEPMTLGNMGELGVRSLDVSCWDCQGEGHAVLICHVPFFDGI